MARSHARVATSVWSDDDWRALHPMAQWMYTTLLSQPKLTLAGSIDVKIRSWSQLAAGVTAADIEAALVQLEVAGFIGWDDDTDEIVIRTFVRNDGVLKNRNLGKGMWAAWAAIESPRLRHMVLDNLPPEAFDEKHDPKAEPPQEPAGPPPGNHSSNRSPDHGSNLPTPATDPCRPAASSPPPSEPPPPVDNHLDAHIRWRSTAIQNPAGYRRSQLPAIRAAAAAGEDLEQRWPTKPAPPTAVAPVVQDHSGPEDFIHHPDGTVTPRRALA